jgi:exodeoxyribonuclease V beta subunit
MTTLLIPRPAIFARLPETGHVVIEAAAGTGKTFTLEHLAVDLLLRQGVPVERLLLVTFTEKATEELRLRVRRKLQEIVAIDAQPLPVPAPGQAWELDDAGRERLRDALARFDTATIATIHGFCQRVLAEHAFAHRRLFDQRLVDARELFERGFRDVLRQALAPGDPLRGALESHLRQGGSLAELESLVFEACSQRGELTPRWDPPGLVAAAQDAAAAWADPLLVKALLAIGAQSTAKVQNPYRELGKLLAIAGELPPATLGERLVTWGALRHEVAKRKDTRWRHLDRGLEKLGDLASARLRDALRRLEPLAAPPLAALVSALRSLVVARLESDKRSQGLYDFDDMLLQVRDGLCRADADPSLLAALRARWSVALIDEFQDTDEVQWDVFRRLFFDSPQHRVFLIGDPRQAIYGFRNADLHTYLGARDAVVAGGGSRVPLLENHRSTPALVGAVNRIVGEGFFSGRLAGVETAAAGNTAARLLAPDGTDAPPVVAWRVRQDGERPAAELARQALSDRIAVEARRLVAGGWRWADAPGDAGRPLSWSDLQVLVRGHREAAVVAAALRRHGLPSALFGQEGLLETPEAAHVQRLLAALAAPDDLAARLGAWLTPFFDVPLADLAGCRDLPESHPLVRRLLDWSADAADRRWARLFRRLLDESGLTRRLLATRQGERELTDYQHVLDLLLEEAHRAPATVADLTGRLRDWRAGRGRPPGADAGVQRLEPDRDAIQVLTMHRVKGLQATVVFVAGGFGDRGQAERLDVYHRGATRCVHLGDAVGEIAEAIDRERAEEDQRLLYVALTRARGRLYLPWLGTDGARGGTWDLVDRRLDALLAGEPPAGFVVEELPVEVVPARRGGPDSRAAATAAPAIAPPAATTAAAVEPDRPSPTTASPATASAVIASPVVAAAATPSPLAGRPAWSPGSERLLALAAAGAPPAAPDSALLGLRGARGGRLLTSYTRIRRQTASLPAEAPPAEVEPPPNAALAAAAEVEADDLPGGRLAGTFVHRLLEELPLDSVRAAADELTWAAEPEIAGLATRLAADSAIAARHVPAALRLAWRALRTPLTLPGLALPAGLASPLLRAVEMELVFPIPEGNHPPLGVAPPPDAAAPPFGAGRGHVQGVVDLVFEHAGRTFFVDWKTDRLPGWDAAGVAAHVEEHYRLQAQLYSLGVVRLLALRDASDHERRFGGLLYCFLRGMATGGGAGVYFERPSWERLLGWERDLAQRRSWGQAPADPRSESQAAAAGAACAEPVA